MIGFFKALLARGLGLASLVATLGSLTIFFPLAVGFLKIVGLPLLIVLMIVGAPLLILLAVMGLPIIIVFAISAVVLGVLGAVFAFLPVLLKIFVFVVLPIWLLVKAIKWVARPRDGGAPPPPPPPPPHAPPPPGWNAPETGEI